MSEPDINYVEGLSVMLTDHLIHICHDVEHTVCGLVIPECGGTMLIRNKPQCTRCIERMQTVLSH